jgi:hypothetical protein
MTNEGALNLRSLLGTAGSARPDRRKVNVGYFVFAFVARAIAYASISLVRGNHLPDRK